MAHDVHWLSFTHSVYTYMISAAVDAEKIYTVSQKTSTTWQSNITVENKLILIFLIYKIQSKFCI